MKTYNVKLSDIKRQWYVVDASEAPLGRVATKVATLLIGKEKPQFSHHIDCGDYVIVLNAEKVVTTGNKENNKMYYHHSGFPGGLKETTLKKQLDEDSREVIVRAIRGMIPANKLRDGRLARLKVYSNSEHSHEAQKPQTVSLKEGQ